MTAGGQRKGDDQLRARGGGGSGDAGHHREGHLLLNATTWAVTGPAPGSDPILACLSQRHSLQGSGPGIELTWLTMNFLLYAQVIHGYLEKQVSDSRWPEREAGGTQEVYYRKYVLPAHLGLPTWPPRTARRKLN